MLTARMQKGTICYQGFGQNCWLQDADLCWPYLTITECNPHWHARGRDQPPKDHSQENFWRFAIRCHQHSRRIPNTSAHAFQKAWLTCLAVCFSGYLKQRWANKSLGLQCPIVSQFLFGGSSFLFLRASVESIWAQSGGEALFSNRWSFFMGQQHVHFPILANLEH